MKKQTLFNLASMPKMVLIITLVVMIGTLFGATSYLLKIPKTDLPIINPVIETQCEINSDCKLVYVYGGCTPCGSTLDEGYQCLPREEAAEISRERQRMLIDPEGPQCSICWQPFEIQHTCECKNGKCEKVRVELVEEVIITTDKMEYEQGEAIKIIFQNNLKKDIILSYCRLSSFPVIEKFENNKWDYFGGTKLWEYQDCEFKINTGDQMVYIWDQKDNFNRPTLSGTYRVNTGSIFLLEVDEKIGDNTKAPLFISNEFTIKEKSAVDARCGEKVKFDSPCHLSKIINGYEFDVALNKCKEVKVYGGCDFKTPFESLKECQEVCEKSKIDSRDILSDEKVYEILKNFAVRLNAANISDDNILLDAIEFQNGDIKERLKKVEHDLNEIGIGDAIDWRGYVNATTKVCIARSIIYNNLKHTCDLKHDSLLSLEDVDDILATEEIIPYFLVGFTYFKSGDYAKASYCLDQIILHRQAEIDRWGESYFINVSGEVYEKIYKKTMQVLDEIEIAANS